MATSVVMDRNERVAAPRLTSALDALLLLGVLVQAVTAGGFLGGHHEWHIWHEAIGNLLLLPPLAGLIVGIVARHRGTERVRVLLLRIAMALLVVIVVLAAHAGRGWLPLHIPAAIALMAVGVQQFVLAASPRNDKR